MAAANCRHAGFCRSVRHGALESAASLAKQSRLVREALERAVGARRLYHALGDGKFSSHQLRHSVLARPSRPPGRWNGGLASQIHHNCAAMRAAFLRKLRHRGMMRGWPMSDESAIIKPPVLDALRSRLRGTALVRGD